MAYLGNAPARNFISFERQVFTIVNSQTAYTLDHSVNNENDIRLVVNNVVQEPGSGKAYTASGTTLTLSAALTNGTDEMYCVFLGRAVGTVNAPAGSVGNSQTAATIVTGQTAETTVADDDTVLIHDTSASALRKMTVSNLTANAGTAGLSSSSGNITITDGNLVVASGHGIDFSADSSLSDGDATLTSELFDDYEEGTWTATVSSNSGSVTVNTSNDECHYTKIGNRIFLSGSIGISSVSSPSGRLTINNKPFDTSGGEGGKRGVITICLHNPASDEGSGIVGMIFESYSPIRLHNSSSGNEINANKMQGSSEIRFQGFYE